MKIGFDAKRAFHNMRGLGNYSRDLIRILQEQQMFELVLFNPKPKVHSGVRIDGHTKVITPKSFFWKKMKSLWRMLKISRLAQTESLDLYHGLSGEIPFGIQKHTRTIVTIHDLIFVRYPQWYSFFDRKMYFWKFRQAAQKSHHIIAISEQTKRDIVEFLGVPSEKISVVYQGCHEAFKKKYSPEIKKHTRKKFALPERFVLYVGAIEPRKNALEIVKAIKDLDIALVLVGKKTKYYDQIEAYCRKHQMKNRVIALKNVSMEELAVIYQLSTIFCYPSIFEGFGIPIVEALFSKVPVITSQGSCFSEAGGEDSIYINLNNATEEIKQAIIAITSDDEKRLQMIEKGFKHAQKFTDSSVYQELISVYNRVITID
ncbi:glycosyltransferase family 4 protein [Capnocytophaga canis]|uniref:Protein rfbU n=1 Tax=Capnocytophaga canis TaxID=1848903 RepID=A0A0B7IPZ8_9FLAO|nr:glycosyltransferase family 1 protein [Capnocytophaga canis]CEN52097.1 Protein rfbU [Capnocytophaga canis]